MTRVRRHAIDDALVGVAVLAGAGLELLIRRPARDLLIPLVVSTLVVGALIPLRRHAPLAAAVAGGLVTFALERGAGSTTFSNGFPVASTAGLMLLVYSAGAHEHRPLSAVAIPAVALGLGLDGSNVVFAVIATVTPWIVGRSIRSRRNLVEQLAAQVRELDEQRGLFARESVRYERARIARELHDIVAHCLSVIVVQAGAGRRLAVRDPGRAIDALDNIEDVAREAREEITRLVEMLGPGSRATGDVGIQLIDELAVRAARTGLPVRCRISGMSHHLDVASADAAYRVVQESVTNALKHAPGADIDITVDFDDAHVLIEVLNGSRSTASSGIERAGGGNGLVGMRERLHEVGGNLVSGAHGTGWRVRALIPCRATPARGSDPASS